MASVGERRERRLTVALEPTRRSNRPLEKPSTRSLAVPRERFAAVAQHEPRRRHDAVTVGQVRAVRPLP